MKALQVRFSFLKGKTGLRSLPLSFSLLPHQWLNLIQTGSTLDCHCAYTQQVTCAFVKMFDALSPMKIKLHLKFLFFSKWCTRTFGEASWEVTRRRDGHRGYRWCFWESSSPRKAPSQLRYCMHPDSSPKKLWSLCDWARWWCGCLEAGCVRWVIEVWERGWMEDGRQERDEEKLVTVSKVQSG